MSFSKTLLAILVTTIADLAVLLGWEKAFAQKDAFGTLLNLVRPDSSLGCPIAPNAPYTPGDYLAYQVTLIYQPGRDNSVQVVSGLTKPGVVTLPDHDFTVLDLICSVADSLYLNVTRPSSSFKMRLLLIATRKMYGAGYLKAGSGLPTASRST